jgi:hypothetical protein
MKICQLCNKEFPLWVKIEGKRRNLNNRKFCLECSPFGSHNTVDFTKPKEPFGEGKLCPKCQEWKVWDQFYARAEGGRVSYCKACHKIFSATKQRSIKAQAVEYKGGKCEDCGLEGHPAIFDFHHISPENKSFTIAYRSCISFERIKSELDKCVLLCSNCHRMRHACY